MQLLESVAGVAPLRVDRQAGVIYGVRLLGPESRNTHGVAGVDGTEYAESAHNDAVRLYEGATCYLNHSPRGQDERDVRDTFGIVRRPFKKSKAGKPATHGDLHFLKSHPMAEPVCEAAERGLAVFGMSHAAVPGRTRIDRTRKKFVIETLEKVKSVDLVFKPATNVSLSESYREPDPRPVWSMIDAYRLPETVREFAETISAGRPGVIAYRVWRSEPTLTESERRTRDFARSLSR